MEWLEALWKLIATNWEWIMAVAVPWGVALIARCNFSSTVKGWLSVAGSLAIGIIAAFAQGIVLTPETLGVFLFAVIGVTTVAYRLFRSFKITSGWLDSLLGLGDKARC